MTRLEILEAIRDMNPDFRRQVETLIDCKARFCKITMKPDPVEDMRKRNGRQRVFLVNVRATYNHMMKRHIDPDYRLNPVFKPSVIKGKETCMRRAILGVVETVVVNGVSKLQYRNVDLKKVESIRCGDIMEDFT